MFQFRLHSYLGFIVFHSILKFFLFACFVSVSLPCWCTAQVPLSSVNARSRLFTWLCLLALRLLLINNYILINLLCIDLILCIISLSRMLFIIAKLLRFGPYSTFCFFTFPKSRRHFEAVLGHVTSIVVVDFLHSTFRNFPIFFRYFWVR